jgi:hypothetical protein
MQRFDSRDVCNRMGGATLLRIQQTWMKALAKARHVIIWVELLFFVFNKLG